MWLGDVIQIDEHLLHSFFNLRTNRTIQKMKTHTAIVVVLFMAIMVQSAFCLKPDHKYIQIPSDVHLQYDSLNIKTTDGFRLTAWLCKSTKAQKNTVVILASSDAGNMSYNLGLVEGLVQNLGINVLTFDYS